jgi:hypothetical protein
VNITGIAIGEGGGAFYLIKKLILKHFSIVSDPHAFFFFADPDPGKNLIADQVHEIG